MVCPTGAHESHGPNLMDKEDARRSSEEGFCARHASHRALSIRTRLLRLINHQFYCIECLFDRTFLSNIYENGHSIQSSHAMADTVTSLYSVSGIRTALESPRRTAK